SEVKIAFERDFVQQTGRFRPADFERLQREFWDLRIPYVSKYAFMEQLAIGEPDGDPDLQAAYRLIAAHLAWLAPEQGRVRSLMRDELDRVFGSDETRVLVAPGRLFARALEELGAERLPLARRILLRMVNVVAPDVGERPTPRLSTAEALDTLHLAVLDSLVALGVVKRAPTTTALYGLAQDEFLASPDFLAWIDEERDFLLWRQRLRTYLEGWEAAGRQTAALLRGSALEQAVRWMDERPAADLWPDERAFIEASLAEGTRGLPMGGLGQPVKRVPASVFISYRRRDGADEAAVLTRHLRRELGAEVFSDVDLAPGDDFQDAIASRVRRASLVLVLIGPEWQRAAVQRNQGVDFVHSEVALALQSNARVVPVLVRGAQMPSEEQLPDELKPLARRHALVLDLSYNAEAQLATVAGLVRKLSDEGRALSAPAGGGSTWARVLRLIRRLWPSQGDV
ncbi:MAG TPA: toll/interleukin-1 receptor domain-containing protein, partial [Ideonella sp.]|nr:toll/interleukin-1 receptor domain-containing protein [Ideonella sp.]